jgi:hypothetical protein
VSFWIRFVVVALEVFGWALRTIEIASTKQSDGVVLIWDVSLNVLDSVLVDTLLTSQFVSFSQKVGISMWPKLHNLLGRDVARTH